MTLLANQILAMQSRLGGNAISLVFLLPCCSAVTVPHCLCMGNPAHPSLGELQAQEEALPAWCAGGKCADSTSEQQSHCWELAVAAQLIYLQQCKTIVNFKCTWDLSPAKSPGCINKKQECSLCQLLP